MSDTNFPKQKSDDAYKKMLTEEQYHVARNNGTERPFTGKYHDNKEKGEYKCVCCGAPLFDAQTKYDSGTGWPSFYTTKENGMVGEKDDTSLFMKRTEVHCSQCGCHLGHLFNDGPQPTGKRYCINSASLDFKKKE